MTDDSEHDKTGNDKSGEGGCASTELSCPVWSRSNSSVINVSQSGLRPRVSCTRGGDRRTCAGRPVALAASLHLRLEAAGLAVVVVHVDGLLEQLDLALEVEHAIFEHAGELTVEGGLHAVERGLSAGQGAGDVG